MAEKCPERRLSVEISLAKAVLSDAFTRLLDENTR
jgi:hypothetical protein